MFMSMSVGPFCDLGQDVDSQNWTQGAVVSLVMDENERECKSSPLSWTRTRENVSESSSRIFTRKKFNSYFWEFFTFFFYEFFSGYERMIILEFFPILSTIDF